MSFCINIYISRCGLLINSSHHTCAEKSFNNTNIENIKLFLYIIIINTFYIALFHVRMLAQSPEISLSLAYLSVLLCSLTEIITAELPFRGYRLTILTIFSLPTRYPLRSQIGWAKPNQIYTYSLPKGIRRGRGLNPKPSHERPVLYPWSNINLNRRLQCDCKISKISVKNYPIKLNIMCANFNYLTYWR